MSLASLFGGRAAHRHVQTYTAAPSDDEMAREIERLGSLAVELGVNVAIARQDDSLVFEFDSFLDLVRFRLVAFGNDRNPGHFVHRQIFAPGEDVYRRAWLRSAAAALDELGIAHRVEKNGYEAAFRFDTVAEHAVFAELVNRNVFHNAGLAATASHGFDPRLN